MAKRFTKDEIDILQANPNVKAVREDRLTLTYEFRLMLWQQWQEGIPIEQTFIQNGFDLKMIGSKYIHSHKKNFKTYGKPSRGTNKTFGVNNEIRTNTQQEIDHLLNSSLFIKSRKGIAFHPDFIDEISHTYPEQSIEDALVSHGIEPQIVGYQRIYLLKKQLDDGSGINENNKQYDTSTIEKLKNHPYIKRISAKQIVFHEQFYEDAIQFNTFHIDRILTIFEIDYTLIPIQTRNRLKYQLNYRKNQPCEHISTDDYDLLCRIEGNKQKALMEMIEHNFTICKECIPHISKQQRKSLCHLIEEMPEDQEHIYTKREILKKVGISKTSYYDIISNETYGLKEQQQEKQDQEDIALIKEVMAYKGYPKGSRMITMMMPKLTGKTFSRGKVLRLMRKGRLSCTVRKANRHKRASKEMLERNVKPNILKRKFRLDRPMINILTDVSYLKYGKNNTAYLSCLKDASSGIVLGYAVSERNDSTLADETLKELEKHTFSSQSMIHSDQGVLYLSPQYQRKVEAMGLIQSMSRRGNCWDNASQESFFGHFKDECEYHNCGSIDEVAELVQNYMEYYNNERPQWTRNKMTPIEFESYLMEMDEEEFTTYKAQEDVKYNKMMKEAGIKAKKRAIDIGAEV